MRRKVTLVLAAICAIALIGVWADRAELFRADGPGAKGPASTPEQRDIRNETTVVQVRVIPAGGVLAWHLRVRSGHGEAPLADKRGHGDADIRVEVSPGNHVARVDVEGAAEPLTQSFEVTAGQSRIVSFVDVHPSVTRM